jgi:hypothetical protein
MSSRKPIACKRYSAPEMLGGSAVRIAGCGGCGHHEEEGDAQSCGDGTTADHATLLLLGVAPLYARRPRRF